MVDFQQMRELLHVRINVVRSQTRLPLHRERDVVGDGQRIEKRAGLKHHGDLAPNLRELSLAEVGDILAIDENPPGVRLEKSEEHTSELQSRQYLVCRLLLEKKKTRQPLQLYYT